jgi:hypothetical protein
MRVAQSALVPQRTSSAGSGNENWFRLSVFALCFLLFCAGNIIGQVNTGSISGTITDQSGAVVPGVKVSFVAISTNQRLVVVTDGSGRYGSGPLRPGEYRIEAEQTGFKHLTTKSFVVQIQEKGVMDLALEVGGAQEQVTVSEAPPLVQTSDASQGSVIEAQRVANMPLNGRDYLQLALLSEGTLPPPGQGRTASGVNGNNNSRAGGFSAGGARTTDNSYLIDGFDNNTDDTSFDLNQAEVIKPSVDAIQEFKVQTNSYPAQFGRAAGGVVNLTLKSGTNLLHGTAYNFVRNEKLDARNYFNHGKQPPYKRNDFGFSLGGPIIRNKLFYFFSWENLLLRESTTNVNTIPTAAMRQGDFSALTVPIYDPQTYNSATNTRQQFSYNGQLNVIPPNRFDPVAKQLLSFLPTPQNGNLSSNYTYIGPWKQDLNRINTREDYQLSQKDQLSVIFNSEESYQPPSFKTLPAPAFGGDDRAIYIICYGSGITWTRLISPTLVTSTRAGWFGDRFWEGPGSEALALGNVALTLGLSVPATGLPVTYPNFGISGYSSIGPSNFSPVWSQGQTRQVGNDTTWTKGAHTLQFGAEVEWIQTNNNNARNLEGTFNFTNRYTRNPLNASGGNAAADFLLGYVDNYAFSTVTRIEARANLVGGYFQDEWKVNKKFTLNAGLRYQYLYPFHDVFDRLANVDLDTNPSQPQLQLASQFKGQGFWGHNSPFDFEPRVGLTYQMFNGKLVVRSGYGMYSPFQRFSPFGDSQSGVVNPPYDVSVAPSSNGITPASMLQNGVPANVVAIQNATSVSLASQQRFPPHSYTQQYNLNIQYQFARNWMLQVGYYGLKGTHLVNYFDTNYVPTLGPGNTNSLRRFKSIFVPTSAATIAGPVQGVTISPLGSILRTEFTGNANFNSMQAKVTHEISQGFTILAAWTWSKALGDTYDSNPQGLSPGYNYQNPGNLRGEYGQLDTQLKQSFVFSGLWNLPYGHGRQFGSQIAPWANSILGGWSLDSIVTVTSGRPFTVTVNGTPSNSGQTDRANIVGDPNAVSGGRTVAHFFNTSAFAANAPYTYGNERRNSIIGPDYSDLDFALEKEAQLFSMKDQPVSLQFRWDVFDVFNHPTFGFPGNVLGTPTFGQLTSANNPRQMQLALKLIW